MPIPPAATARWKAIRSSETTSSGVRASKVADLMVRLRRVMGPSLAGLNTSGALFITAADHAVLHAVNGGPGGDGRMWRVVAIPLDGKLTRDEIFVDLKERVTALIAAGRTPGLGTVLVGDDP